MEPAVDPFHPLLRLLERYRHDVHHLRAPAGEQQFPIVQQHLGQPIPASLRAFLARWNGAVLFRGALRIRGVADLAAADPESPEVILFADGPKDADRWGYARVDDGWHFGRWDGHRLIAMHEHFGRWLYAQARLLDEDVWEPLAQVDLRLDVDPQNGLLTFARGELLLEAGDGDAALKAYRRTNALAPDHPRAWQRTGEALLSIDRPQATHALMMALRCSALPLAYPGAPSADAGIIGILEAQFPPGDVGWERELHQFLHERCANLPHADGVALFEAAALALSRVHLARNERVAAREALQGIWDRSLGFTRQADLPGIVLAMIALDTDLGHHDEAEELIRRLRRHDDAQVRARAELGLARIALLREEPWGEEIARAAFNALTAPEDRCDAALLLAERGDHEALEEARRLAVRLGDPARLARCELVLGDAARERGDIPAACQHYLACEADAETHLRAHVRLGDLAADPVQALPHYREATKGYRTLGLPLREAWARLRLARCGEVEQAEEALTLFKQAGLAAGVAAAEVVLGRPGQSLSWHISLAAEHARQRYDAQRMRPPLSRADADRPERRLGAHRRAIAACDTRIVQVLSDDLWGELKKIQASDGRVRDPAAMRFVAGVDLLAGHPSFDAARLLMDLLRQDVQQDTAHRALVGAMARSPNMSLVEALLDTIRGGGEPRSVAHAVEILGWRREREAAPRLRELVATASLPIRRVAITALGRIGDEEAIDLILPALDTPELAEVASVALLLLGEWRGVDFHGQALARDLAGLSQSPGEIVGRFGGPAYLLLLLSVADREGPAALGALQGLGLLGSVSAVPRLIEHTGSRDPTRQSVAMAALEVLTGHRADAEESQPRSRWEAWWSEHGHRMPDGARYREGKPFTVRSMIARLAHDDSAVRQVGYDELVISTGECLPFDADGPWRVQQAHRAGWERWWADNAHAIPEHGWLFAGRGVG